MKLQTQIHVQLSCVYTSKMSINVMSYAFLGPLKFLFVLLSVIFGGSIARTNENSNNFQEFQEI